jgi:hypothetical protein
MLTWEKRAHLRLLIGFFLTAIFDGILLGVCLAPYVGVLFKFSSPDSIHDSYWDSRHVTVIKLVWLALTLGAFILMLSGLLRYRLIRYAPAQPFAPAT